MIPKIIHYCWLSSDPIPEDLQMYMTSWKEKLPDYEFMLWNFDRFNINQSDWVREAFSVRKYAFAADYIRLYALCNFGGIYMDMDVEVMRSFNPYLDQDYILGYETSKSVEAGIMGTAPNNPIFLQALDYYTDRHFIKADGSYDTLPLPLILWRCWESQINSGEIKLLPSDYLSPKSHVTDAINSTENTITIHHYAGSWVQKTLWTRFVRCVRRCIPNFILLWYNRTKKQLKQTKL